MANVTWQDALDRLKEGNARGTSGDYNHPNTSNDHQATLTSGQAPFAIILSCADSRVVPEYAFDQGMGDIFVIRVAGNVANASSMASIEYAVAHLGTKLIVVLGHESCGAVTAAIAGGDNGPNLNHLLDHIQPAVQQAGSNDVNTVVKKNAELTGQALIDNSSIIANAVQNDGVKIVPAYYNLGDGKVDFL